MLAGLAFQEAIEASAARMGGGDLVCPAQRVSDFIDGTLSTEPLPRSSYRRGVKSAPLHELYPAPITGALRKALERFERRMPGFCSGDALLHGAETRTSAPVQIVRHRDRCEADGELFGLYPAGEGAGYAGGIMSAAVDGMRVARAVVAQCATGALAGKYGGGQAAAPDERESTFASDTSADHL